MEEVDILTIQGLRDAVRNSGLWLSDVRFYDPITENDYYVDGVHIGSKDVTITTCSVKHVNKDITYLMSQTKHCNGDLSLVIDCGNCKMRIWGYDYCEENKSLEVVFLLI